MEISVPKTKVLIVSPVPVPAVAFPCNDNPVEQVTTFKYSGLHFDQSSAVAHLISPIKSKAGGSCAAIQRRHSLLQCGKTISLHLRLLQAVLAPALQYGCQVWGMHSSRVAAGNHARLDLQRLYDYYLRTLCGLLPSTPRRILLQIEFAILSTEYLWAIANSLSLKASSVARAQLATDLVKTPSTFTLMTPLVRFCSKVHAHLDARKPSVLAERGRTHHANQGCCQSGGQKHAQEVHVQRLQGLLVSLP